MSENRETTSQIELAWCHPLVPGLRGNYGPDGLSLGSGLTFTILFTISFIFHGIQTWRTKEWWGLLFALGALSTSRTREHI